jgi:hypothetical protein
LIFAGLWMNQFYIEFGVVDVDNLKRATAVRRRVLLKPWVVGLQVVSGSMP